MENENPELARYVMQTSCINGDIYVLCGKDSLGDYLFDVWKYDFGELEWVKWEAAVPMAARAYHKAAAMKGKIWISGGENDEGDIDEMWSYNPGLHSWEQKADMPYALSGHTMVSNNDELYVYGVVTKTLRYDYDDDLWYMQIPVNDPPPNRIYHTTVPNWENNSMIVFGGQTLEGEELSDIWEYFYDTNKWSYRGEMPISLTQSAGVMIHSSTRQSGTFLGSIDRVVLFGGISGGVPTNRTFVNYPNLVNIFLPLVLRS
ncbi:MAG: hypothetical protein JXA42_11140 [Anaerolineales bacterium]|nr:hypothetical protein [Anaerolineales bacterium]